jgi:hypothetical protein
MTSPQKTILSLLILTAWLILTPLICMAQQKLEIDDPVYRFQGIAEGIPVSHTFKLKNIGDAPLIIKKVAPP